MQNFLNPGETVAVLAPRALTAGEGALVGALFGVANSAAASGAAVELSRRGVFTLAKTSAQAWTQGAKLYWDNSGFVATTTASGNTLIGVAMEIAANPSATGVVLLDGAVR